ncbi:MAG: phosphoribosylformylglycinamidine synthase-associated small membrane protein [Hyphomicrobiaceae bacterium]
MSQPAERGPSRSEDAVRAIRFLALKAAIFILLPFGAAAVAVVMLLK